MKRRAALRGILPAIALVILLSILWGRYGRTIPLLPEDIDREQGVTLCRWDGTAYQGKRFYYRKSEAILNYLCSLSGRPGPGIEPPEPGTWLWGIRAFRLDGYEVEAVWCEGIGCSPDGENIQVEVDFPALWQMESASNWDWEAAGAKRCPSSFPNYRNLAMQNGRWVIEYLHECLEPVPDDEVALLCEIGEDQSLNCQFINHGYDRLTIGLDYYLHVQLDGVWYRVPGDYEFFKSALTLPRGGDYAFQPWMDDFLPLPDGLYRVVKPYKSYPGGFVAAEFSIVRGKLMIV